MSMPGKRARDMPGELLFVFDNEDAHGAMRCDGSACRGLEDPQVVKRVKCGGAIRRCVNRPGCL
jgi:hypothetical protein